MKTVCSSDDVVQYLAEVIRINHAACSQCRIYLLCASDYDHLETILRVIENEYSGPCPDCSTNSVACADSTVKVRTVQSKCGQYSQSADSTVKVRTVQSKCGQYTAGERVSCFETYSTHAHTPQ